MVSAASSSPAIVAENAAKLFLDGTVVAFRQLSLAIRAQEIMCIVGPSGCGKTTFLRAIAGLTGIDSGALLVNGKQVSGPPDGVAIQGVTAGVRAVAQRGAYVPAFRDFPAGLLPVEATI